MQRYLTVGTDKISEDLFWPIEDLKTERKNTTGNIVKPTGGLWLTNFHEVYPHYNEWVDYILTNVHLLFYKNINRNPFLQPCSVIQLKNSSKIFVLDSLEKLHFLREKYPHPLTFFSYEALSCDYDGIFVQYDSFYTFDKDRCELKNPFLSYGVNTLLLFNTQAIDYYQAAVLNILETDFNWDGTLSDASYTIQMKPEKKLVTPTFNQGFDYSIALLCQKIDNYLRENQRDCSSLDYNSLCVLISSVIKKQFSFEAETITNAANIQNSNLCRVLTKKIKEKC